MENADRFARLMQSAIQREESELKAPKNQNSRITENTVQAYGEAWLWPAFLKQAREDLDCPKLHWEKKLTGETSPVNLCFCDDCDHALGTFELKPLFPVPGRETWSGWPQNWYRNIVDDFRKQWERSRKFPEIEHYVVLIPHGEPRRISQWFNEELQPALRQAYPDLRIQEAAQCEQLQLNNKRSAAIKVFRVTSAEAFQPSQ